MRLSDSDLDSIPEANRHGNCFEVALNTFLKNPTRYTLVHGVVTGQGPVDGIEFCHAWVEDGNMVIDNTQSPSMSKLPKQLYYAIGNIQITRRYNYTKTLEAINKYGTYGPWDSVFDEYC